LTPDDLASKLTLENLCSTTLCYYQKALGKEKVYFNPKSKRCKSCEINRCFILKIKENDELEEKIGVLNNLLEQHRNLEDNPLILLSEEQRKNLLALVEL
jgi:hypothetical protein